MDSREQIMVSVRSREIVLNPVKDDEDLPQMKMIGNIMGIVAKDTTVDRI